MKLEGVWPAGCDNIEKGGEHGMVEGLEDFERRKPHHQHNAATSGKIHLPPLIKRHPTNPRGCLL